MISISLPAMILFTILIVFDRDAFKFAGNFTSPPLLDLATSTITPIAKETNHTS